jgi:hypothetical protein
VLARSNVGVLLGEVHLDVGVMSGQISA